MSRVFECSGCRQEIKVEFLKPGEVAKCKHCGASNVVPAEGETPVAGPGTGAESLSVLALNSPRLARWLLVFLWLQLGLDFVFFILGYMARDMFSPIGHAAFGQMFLIVVAASTLVSLVLLIVFIVWILDLHRDLVYLFPDYPITPGWAVARLLIPIYNLWGTWNVFVTMVRTFQEDSDRLRKPGTTLYSWLIVMYSALILSYLYIGEKVMTVFSEQNVISYEGLLTGWDLFGIVLGIVTLIAYIGMTQTISLALNEKSDSLSSRIVQDWRSQTAS